MNRSLTTAEPLGLPVPARPAPHPLEAILTGSGPAFMGLFEARQARLSPEFLAPVAEHAEDFLRRCAASAVMLRDATEPASDEDISAELLRFVGAWPNASHGDLASYGAQLAQDVIDRQPCRYALGTALRHLRQTSRFLPSIAEVLGEIDRAQSRIRNTVWHVEHTHTMLARMRPGRDACSDERSP